MSPRGFVFSKEYFENKQIDVLFLKRKTGLYKTTNFVEKYSKQKIITLSNLIKNQDSFMFKPNIKKPKIIFYKKLDRFYYRLGRKLLVHKLNFKKYAIQSLITKKIYNLIKKPYSNILSTLELKNLLISCNLFYTQTDAKQYITNFGVMLDGIWNFDDMRVVSIGNVFSLRNDLHFFSFLKKNKHKTINNLKKIKFYKYRIKQPNLLKKSDWTSMSSWLTDNSFLYTNKTSNIEFDIKTLTGCYLYNNNNTNFVKLYNNTNITMYMTRSYNWKYLT